MPITRLYNPIQEYAWGCHTFIADLLGRPVPSPAPWAELWLGAHPKAPSRLKQDGRWQTLPEVIAAAPDAVLGPECARQYDNRLPFLLKVLSAGQPLSIQAHPNQVQARQGFEAENAAGLALDNPRRNYRDANHKPELITALTRFQALCGFRPVTQSLPLLQAVCADSLPDLLTLLQEMPPQQGLALFLAKLLTLPQARRRDMVTRAVRQAAARSGDAALEWVVRLHRFYPDDVGILAPLFLNLYVLEPPQALFLPAGELHAYLEGSAIEIMANSDNVIRGGLTSKHVDTTELLRILTYSSAPGKVLLPQAVAAHTTYFNTPAEEFRLWRIDTTTASPGTTATDANIIFDTHQVSILLCTGGEFTLKTVGGRLQVPRGTAVLLPADTAPVALSGRGICYRAALP